MPGTPAIVMVHGLGGTPASLGQIPDRLRSEGWTVVTPLLPGHGTDVGDLASQSGDEWLAAVDQALPPGPVVLVGQSLGGVLSLILASGRPDVVGVAALNAPVLPADPDAVEHLEWLRSRGTVVLPAGEPDLADPDARDEAYGDLPVTSLLELARLSTLVHGRLASVRVPVLVVTSALDGVVDPVNGDELARLVAGPVTRLRLERSRHVACLDLDRELLADGILAWLDTLRLAS